LPNHDFKIFTQLFNVPAPGEYLYLLCTKVCLWTSERRTDGRPGVYVFTVLASLQRGCPVGALGSAERRAGLASGWSCRSARRLAGRKSLWCRRRDYMRVRI